MSIEEIENSLVKTAVRPKNAGGLNGCQAFFAPDIVRTDDLVRAD